MIQYEESTRITQILLSGYTIIGPYLSNSYDVRGAQTLTSTHGAISRLEDGGTAAVLRPRKAGKEAI